MHGKPKKNVFTAKARDFFLKQLTSSNKELIKVQVFNQLSTKYPQFNQNKHQPVLKLIIFNRYWVGAFLIVFALISAIAVEGRIKANPNDKVPYLTKRGVEQVKSKILELVSGEKAHQYQIDLVARRAQELSTVVKDSKGDSAQIITVTEDLANRLDQLRTGAKLSPNQTEFVLKTVKEAHIAVSTAKELMSKKGDDPAAQDALVAIDKVSRIQEDVLKEQIAFKLAQAKQANQQKEAVVAAQAAFELGDFFAALEKLELAEKDAAPGLVQGARVSASPEVQASASQEAEKEESLSSVNPSGAKPQRARKSNVNVQIEFPVGIGE